MTHIIVLLGGVFVGALAGVLVMSALIAAGRATEVERDLADAEGPQQRIAGPSGDSPSYLRGSGISAPSTPGGWSNQSPVPHGGRLFPPSCSTGTGERTLAFLRRVPSRPG